MKSDVRAKKQAANAWTNHKRAHLSSDKGYFPDDLRGLTGRTNGASVTQTEGPVILSEGSSLTLNCNYQTSYSGFLFWYVQYLHQEPQLLLQSTTENQRMEHQGFHATLVKKDSSFHLHKSSLQLSDSAVYYCALGDTVRGTTEGAEHKPRGVQLGLWVGSPGRGELGFPPKS
uniref:Ig-like domain-containing protein n=1 Tax=Oryctolagus cuniculus TaxID=9986 RepID=A0A5F9DJ27_RABIT